MKPIARHLVALAAAGLLLGPPLAAGARASAERVDLTYRVFLGGIPIVEVDTKTTVDGSRYRMDSLTRTVGLWESLFKARMQSRVDGEVNGAEASARPDLYQVRYDGRVGKRRSIDVYFDAEGPDEIVTVPPNAEDGRRPVEPEFLMGAMDPATAAMLAAEAGPNEQICQREFKIFDGRRRYDVAFENKGPARIEAHDDAFYSGEAIHCVIRYRRIKGFDPSWERANARKYPNEIDIWFARFPDLPRAIPVKVQVSTEYGTAMAQLVARHLAPTDSLGAAAALLPPPDLKRMGG